MAAHRSPAYTRALPFECPTCGQKDAPCKRLSNGTTVKRVDHWHKTRLRAAGLTPNR
jgi:hypothetical protein